VKEKITIERKCPAEQLKENTLQRKVAAIPNQKEKNNDRNRQIARKTA
jgi:hypothetical protein